MSSDSRPMTITLNYDHGDGYFAPYFEHLMQGRPLASLCPKCDAAWFPPAPTCPNDGAETIWHEIDTQGRIVSLTRTRSRLPFADGVGDHTFVLVLMDEAVNAVLGRLRDDDGEIGPGARVELSTPVEPVAHPAQAVRFKALQAAE